jgi:hypothetical protein
LSSELAAVAARLVVEDGLEYAAAKRRINWGQINWGQIPILWL